MIFSGSEAPDCGGFGELKIGAVRSDAAPKTSTQSTLPYFTAGTDMMCREGPSTSHVDRWFLKAGEMVQVLAQWAEDPNWLLVDIEAPATDTRTDCCWVGGEGELSVSLDQIKTINFLPDRLDCSAVKVSDEEQPTNCSVQSQGMNRASLIPSPHCPLRDLRV